MLRHTHASAVLCGDVATSPLLQLHLFALSIVKVKHLRVPISSAASPDVCNVPVQHHLNVLGTCLRMAVKIKAFISASLIFALICLVAVSDSGYCVRRYFADMVSPALVPLDESDSLFCFFFMPAPPPSKCWSSKQETEVFSISAACEI